MFDSLSNHIKTCIEDFPLFITIIALPNNEIKTLIMIEICSKFIQ